ncbi:NACHT domain-containing protein [Ferrimonas aestuarii]|uniref:NACHT C-terminal Helical domain-containing protein n=1 Tax=Ferrimonas aestuarii TaxID=2569539 RepID=A0A4U1BS94_9GAMM|nr:hypothetical protein [Ferrimonas aestuarii]TKB58547.1 hypothetical protein FCL42_02020 [Ferrimonas aestuarii]
MDKAKQNKLLEIKDEVKDFHPLLRTLFNKIPNIKSVIYTQGPNEMGADFILTKDDEILGEENYIGCVVKVGQIKQDHSEIERQVEECKIERTIEGGKKRIILNEIWVISNSNITHNAQRKISTKFASSNIKFIAYETLGKLIDSHYPAYWDDIDFKTGAYLESVRKFADNLRRSNLISEAAGTIDYVEQRLKKESVNRKMSDKQRLRQYGVKQVLSSSDLLMIEAVMGTGKSTLLANLAMDMASVVSFNSNGNIPILLPFKEFISDFDCDVSSLINSVKTKISKDYGKKFLVMLDGFDESKMDSREKLSKIEKIVTTKPAELEVGLVITTRGFDDPELEKSLEKSFDRYSLCPLTTKQVVSLIGQVCKVKVGNRNLIKDLDKSPLMKVLPKTPISALLLAKLLNENIQEIPSTMTDLYGKYMELSLGRWDMDKGLQSQQEYDVVDNVTIELARFMMDNSLYEVSLGDAKELVNRYVNSRNLRIDKDEVFELWKGKADIFVVNRYKNTIRFRHRTFAEYFYAAGLDKNHNALISERMFDTYWSSTYFFFIGLQRDCPDILEEIGKINFSSDALRLMRVFNSGDYMLAAYLTPYTVVKKFFNDSMADAARIYCDTVSGKTKGGLSSLPTISLLCILTHTFCDTLGFEYFSEAIDERSLELCTRGVLNDVESVELFWLNSIQLSMGDKNAYDKMLENYGDSIPLALQRGIVEHANDVLKSTKGHTIVDRFIKKHERKIKKNLTLKQSVYDLYLEPILSLDKLDSNSDIVVS